MIGKILAIDFGTVRVGLAISDPDRKFAFPLETYQRDTKERDQEYFQKLMKREDIHTLLMGLPVHLSGEESQKSYEARQFGAWLQEVTKLPVVYFDERFTSVQAENFLLEAGLTNKRRKARRDRVAAQILLQTYLDAGCPDSPEVKPLDE